MYQVLKVMQKVCMITKGLYSALPHSPPVSLSRSFSQKSPTELRKGIPICAASNLDLGFAVHAWFFQKASTHGGRF